MWTSSFSPPGPAHRPPSRRPAARPALEFGEGRARSGEELAEVRPAGAPGTRRAPFVLNRSRVTMYTAP